MSSSNLQEDIDRAYQLGVNAYLVKPTAFDELVETLKTTTEFWKDFVAHPSKEG
jgi:DNA-binding NarL/FixJ family response regulator